MSLLLGVDIGTVTAAAPACPPSAAERLAVCHGVEPAVRNRPARSGGR